MEVGTGQIEPAELESELLAAQRRIDELERELAASESLRGEIVSSRSWRLTAPLRGAARWPRERVVAPLRRGRGSLASVGAFGKSTPGWLDGLTGALTRLPLRSTKRLLYNRRYWSTGDPLKRPLYNFLADALYEELEPANAVDVGCGTGIIIARLAERGVDVRGIEGSGAAIAASPIGDRIEHRDLTRGVPQIGSFDVCLCVEVAEHLPPATGPALVAGLTRLSDLVVFTAATPGQGGMGHLNERPHDYWAARFAEQGFEPSPLRKRLAATIAAVPDAPWVKKNLQVFECQVAAR